MKLLSPAGNFESLKMAVYNGADEIYLGINDFNARNNIDGFNLDNLKPAVDFAHAFSVKVLLAINILFSDKELQSALDLIVDAFNIGVDAFIVQDLGLIKLISENFPQIELHASTQMGLHNLEGVEQVLKYGIKRIVLSRETPLSEIKRIKQNTDVEIEYFVQGALCVCFSGNCYMSSYLFSASGNRGKCKQPCRLPYTLLYGGKNIKSGYLLSAKDFNMSDRLKDLEQAGVDVLKIEGRARRPFYVAKATAEYYKALHGGKVDKDGLKLAFNRDYTEGYFNGNGNIISEIQSHIGILVGNVEKVVSGKTFNEVFFSSNRDLSPKSTFKIFSGNQEKTTFTAYDLKAVGNGKYRTTTTHLVKVGDTVRLIVDALAESQTLQMVKKRAIPIKLYLETDKPIKAVVGLDEKEFSIVGGVLQSAKNQPISEQELNINFSKHGLFYADLKVEKLEKVFMPKTELNDFRRKVFESIYQRLIFINRPIIERVNIRKVEEKDEFSDFCFVSDISDALTAKNVVYSPDIYDVEKIKELKSYCEKQRKTLYLDTPNFALEKDIILLKEIINETGVGIIANNYYALSLCENVVVGAGLNVFNAVSASVLKKPFFTAESDDYARRNFAYMTLRHCPIKSHIGGTCANCKYVDGIKYRLESGKTFKLKRKKLSDCTFYLTD